MVVGPILWPTSDSPLFPKPTAAQLPFFIVLQVVTSLTFGLGVSLLLFGLPVVRRVSADWKLRAWLMYLSIGWLLVSWWPHGHLHQHNGHDVQGLLYIEYGFHVAPMLAGLILAYCFLPLMRERSGNGTREVSEGLTLHFYARVDRLTMSRVIAAYTKASPV